MKITVSSFGAPAIFDDSTWRWVSPDNNVARMLNSITPLPEVFSVGDSLFEGGMPKAVFLAVAKILPKGAMVILQQEKVEVDPTQLV